MRNKIYKKDKNLIIETPLENERWNPYSESVVGKMSNIIALIESEHDMGFCYRIDMSYKGKDDQWTDYFYKWHGEQKEFEELCKKLDIDIIYYSSPNFN